MVDLATGRRGHEFKGRPSPIRPWMVGALVVVSTAAVVLLLRGLVVWDQARGSTLWMVFAALLGVAALRRALSSSGTKAFGSDEPARGGTPAMGRTGVPHQHEARRHRRFVPARRATVLHLGDGRTVPARIVDISIAGVAVHAPLTDLEFLSVTRVGSRAAGPVRQMRGGAVFGFDTLLDPQPFDDTFVL